MEWNERPRVVSFHSNRSNPVELSQDTPSSHGRGAAKYFELLTEGTQYIVPENMTPKNFVRATRPTLLCASLTLLCEKSYHTNREFLT